MLPGAFSVHLRLQSCGLCIGGQNIQELPKKKRLGRLRKAMGDHCLLAGSPKNAAEHYMTAMDLLRVVNDFVWLGAAQEGYACAKAKASTFALVECSCQSLAYSTVMPPQMLEAVFERHDLSQERHRALGMLSSPDCTYETHSLPQMIPSGLPQAKHNRLDWLCQSTQTLRSELTM